MPASLPRLPRPDVSSNEILVEVRHAIRSGEVLPGRVLVPGEIADRFGASHVAVREALHTLVGEALVEVEPEGYRVAGLSPDELREMYLVRETLEAAALAAAVTQADTEDHRIAAETHERLEQAYRHNDPVAYHRESRRFHLAITRPSGMHRLVHMLESAWNITEPTRTWSSLDEDLQAALHDDHRRQLEAFLGRDVAELLMVSEQHHARLVTALTPHAASLV